MPVKTTESKPKSARYSRWFRMYVEFIHDPKTATLTDRQGWAWVRLLAIAKQSDGGILPSTKDIAFHLRCSINDAENVVHELIEMGLLDVQQVSGSASVLKPHAWDARQFKWDGVDCTKAERQKRWRQTTRRMSNGRRNGRVTEVASVSVSVSDSVSSSEVVSIQEEDCTTVKGMSAREVLP
jgi:hypothetical protein